MPMMFSYNFEGADGVHNSRVQSMFERFGWQNVGGSCYRFPTLDAGAVWPEDWFNQVIPALMCFRAYVLHHQLTVPKFSLDVSASTGYDQAVQAGPVGNPPANIQQRSLVAPTNQQFGAQQLTDWLQSVTDNVPY